RSVIQSGCIDFQENAWQYENLDTFEPSVDTVPMWQMGFDQSHQHIDGTFAWVADTYTTQLRQGNWDYVTTQQRWYAGTGIGARGTPNSTSQTIPNSLYAKSKPAFFAAADPWPWADPSTGATSILPAKWCFQQHQMPNCRQGM